jgi:hypothetical protein
LLKKAGIDWYLSWCVECWLFEKKDFNSFFKKVEKLWKTQDVTLYFVDIKGLFRV